MSLRKSTAVFIASSGLSLVLLACGEDDTKDPEGGSGSSGTGATGGAGGSGGAGGGGGASGSGGGGGCTVVLDPTTSECKSYVDCAESECDSKACLGTGSEVEGSTCEALRTCMSGCACDDFACLAACALTASAECQACAQAVRACTSEKCGTELEACCGSDDPIVESLECPAGDVAGR